MYTGQHKKVLNFDLSWISRMFQSYKMKCARTFSTGLIVASLQAETNKVFYKHKRFLPCMVICLWEWQTTQHAESCIIWVLCEHIIVLCSVCGVLFENRVHSLLANHIAMLSPLYRK